MKIYTNKFQYSQANGISRQTVYNQIDNGSVLVLEDQNGKGYYINKKDLLNLAKEALINLLNA